MAHQVRGYGAGHPWYYVRGGKPLYPRQIAEEAKRAGYHGYLASEIARLDALPEPKRSQTLRAMKAKALADYRADLSRYRELVLELHRERAEEQAEGEPVACNNLHGAVALKHNHLYNDLAHLRVLAQMLGRQRDLFDL